MNFSDFAKMLYPHIGKGKEIPAYVLSLIDMVMEDPSDEVDIAPVKMIPTIRYLL